MTDVQELTALANALAVSAVKTEEKINNLTETVSEIAGAAAGGQVGDHFHSGSASSQSPPVSEPEPPTSPQQVRPELQAAARQIQTKYQSVFLEPSLKLHDSRQGIQGDNLKILNVLQKCGRFAETCLKVLAKQENPQSVNAEGTAELFTLFAAQISYLQDDFGCLFVTTLGIHKRPDSFEHYAKTHHHCRQMQLRI